MKQRKPSRLCLMLGLLLAAGACDFFNKVTATKIKDILDHPRKYDQKEVTVYGTVTEEASLFVVKYFVIQDDTGSIRVTTDRALPKQGEKLRVTGTVESIEFGPARAIVIREKPKPEKGS
ncbi:MAG TPA: hypothetical protein VNL14_02970 [Candidatus Acidoferrales bacterium]|nr:hypothetical protein [Candidatus Acidoferrales bacterium]